MPQYRLSAQIIKRADARSVIAAAAYRAGERLRDEQADIEHDYTRRGGVAHKEIMAPDDAPDWVNDRQALWNAVEKMERRKDAQLAREVTLSLPHELKSEDRLKLVRSFIKNEFVREGMVADVAIHEPQPEKGDDPRNHHAHVLLSMRQMTRNGFRTTKTREWNSDTALKAWRAKWADVQNQALSAHGISERVDHRTLKAQRQEALERGEDALAAELDRIPEIHIGPKSRPMGEKGYQPKSKSRQARSRFGRTRTRAYDKKDQGNRAAHNARIIQENRQRSKERLEKLGQRKQWAERESRETAFDAHSSKQRMRNLMHDIYADAGKAQKQFSAVSKAIGIGPAFKRLIETPSQIARMKGIPKSKTRKRAWHAVSLFKFHYHARYQAKRRHGAMMMVLNDVSYGFSQALGMDQKRVNRLRGYRKRYGVIAGLVPAQGPKKRQKSKGRKRQRRANGPKGLSSVFPRNNGPSSRG